jgi:transcriptional regulator with XRE-family HTH domain
MDEEQLHRKLAKNVARIREREGLSQAGLARRIGVAHMTVWRVEDGQGCRLPVLAKIAKALKSSPNELISWR